MNRHLKELDLAEAIGGLGAFGSHSADDRYCSVWPPAVSQAKAPVPEAPQRVTINEGLLTGGRART